MSSACSRPASTRSDGSASPVRRGCVPGVAKQTGITTPPHHCLVRRLENSNLHPISRVRVRTQVDPVQPELLTHGSRVPKPCQSVPNAVRTQAHLRELNPTWPTHELRVLAGTGTGPTHLPRWSCRFDPGHPPHKRPQVRIDSRPAASSFRTAKCADVPGGQGLAKPAAVRR